MRLQRQEHQGERGGPFKIKHEKSAKKKKNSILCVLSRIRPRNKAFSVIFWLVFCPSYVSGCFTPACPGSFKKKKALTVTGDSRKELLPQRFSSVPRPAGLSARAFTRVRTHRATCAHVRPRGPRVQPLNYTITQSSNAPPPPLPPPPTNPTSRSRLVGFAAQKCGFLFRRPFKQR